MAEVSFGEWLKRRRKAEGLTQEQLAQQLNCSTITLRKIEGEERRPSPRIVQQLAEIFKIPQNEQTTFLQFARGDWRSAPIKENEGAPWRAATKSTHSNIPATTTSLIGREKEIVEVHDYLLRADIRLVTLIGPPGIGKTRLSIESARTPLPNFPDGVFFVALAPLDDPALIAVTIAQALGYVGTTNISTTDQLKEGIGDKRMLIVLDNCEHLIEDVASLTSSLLSACSWLKILATSRESLRISGEWLYFVPTLDVPKEGSSIDMETASKFPALSLFAERARAVHSDFALNADNIQAVASICAQLDGLPLAIELIAARIRLMSPQTLLAKLNDQFVLSADGMRAVSVRQKTLHGAIAWSYDLLSPEEQNLFARLSVFAGGFTPEAAESIFSRTVRDKAVADLIASLLDKSLLQCTFNERGEPRFSMLVTLQQFALNHLRHLGEETEIRNWHLAYFLEFAERAEKQIHGPDQVKLMDRLDAEHDNYRAALDWCVSNSITESALRLLGALDWAWLVRARHTEAYSWFAKIYSLPEITNYPGLYGKVLNQIGFLGWLLGNYKSAGSVLEESQEIWLRLGTKGEQGLAEALNYSGMIVLWSLDQDNDRAQSLFERSFELFQKLGDQRGMAFAMLNLGRAAFDRNEDASALSLFDQSLELFSQLGDLWSIGRSSLRLGELFLKERNYEKALFFIKQYLMICEELHFRQGITMALNLLGDLYRHQGNYDQAEQVYEKSQTISREYGLKENQYFAFLCLGLVALHQKDYVLAARYFKDCYNYYCTVFQIMIGIDLIRAFAAICAGMNKFERAARLYGAAQALMNASNITEANYFPYRAELIEPVQIAREQLGEAAFEALTAEGRAMTIEQAIAYALEDQDC